MTDYERKKIAPPSYTAIQPDGNPLPEWLNFNALTKIFSGTPTEAGELRIIVTATDNSKASETGIFKLLITT